MFCGGDVVYRLFLPTVPAGRCLRAYVTRLDVQACWHGGDSVLLADLCCYMFMAAPGGSIILRQTQASGVSGIIKIAPPFAAAGISMAWRAKKARNV
jgi:hypothetical protein